jgi:hypothetical protein
MAITFGQAKERISQFAGRGGKCPTNKSVDSFVREVLDYMLISGEYGSVRKFTFNAIKGVFTAPYELETIIKVKINGAVGSSWDRFFEWSSGSGDLVGCLPANAIYEEPNYSPLVYDVPSPGTRIGVLGLCDEAPDAHIIVKGFDATGRQIITMHNGEQIVGEYLSIKKGTVKYTNATFARVTEVIKTRTNGYTQLLWVLPEQNERGFLADYSPFEEKPQYRRFRLNTQCAPSVMVSVLGRIRLKEHYADNDLIPFDNLYALSIAAQGINSNYNNDPQTAVLKDQMLQSIIERENTVKKPNPGSPFDTYQGTSGGSIKGIVF